MVQEEDLLLAPEEDILLAQEEYLLAAQEEDLLVAQEEDLLVAQEEDLLVDFVACRVWLVGCGLSFLDIATSAAGLQFE